MMPGDPNLAVVWIQSLRGQPARQPKGKEITVVLIDRVNDRPRNYEKGNRDERDDDSNPSPMMESFEGRCFHFGMIP